MASTTRAGRLQATAPLFVGGPVTGESGGSNKRPAREPQPPETSLDLDSSRTALIVGDGPGLGAALARKLSGAGVKVALAARDIAKLAAIAQATGAEAFACDASRPADVERLFQQVGARFGTPDIVVYNASARARGPIAGLEPGDVQRTLAVSAFGGFLVAQQAAHAMIPRGSGVLLFTGASASLKGFAQSAPFAMGKFALRGLAQSAARELGPKGIHVCHVVIDGAIGGAAARGAEGKPDGQLDPDAIADSYLHLIAQPCNAWTHEIDLRPWTETF